MSQLTICLIIFVLTVICYCTGIFSLATTALMSMLLLTLTGCLSASEGLSYFGNSTVIMIAGMCVVAEGFNRTKYCMVIADKIASVSKGSLMRLLGGYVIIGVILSQFIQSPAVVFGVVAPLLLASGEAAGYSPSKLMFPLGVAIVITCSTIPVGAGATVYAELNGYMESYGYTEHLMSLIDPMIGRLPLLIIATIFLIFVQPKLMPEKPVVEPKFSAKKAAEKPPLKDWQDVAGLVIFFGDALALMFADVIGIATWQITLIGAVLMVVFGVLKPKEATDALPMSMLLLIAGALAMAGALSATGAGELIGGVIANAASAVGGNSYIIGAIFFIIPFIMTQVMTNRAVMLIFHPIAIATCAAMGGSPIGLMLIIQAACLSAFMTPMATGAIPYIMDYGGYDQVTMIKSGLPLCAIACVVSVGWIMTIFPIL